MWAIPLVPVMPVALLETAVLAYRQSNPIGKLIVYLLFVGSMVVWTIMVTKWKELREIRRKSGRFLRAYRKAEHPVMVFHTAPPGNADADGGPLRELYTLACRTLAGALETDRAARDSFEAGLPFAINQKQLDAVRNVVDRAVADQALALESNMALLANAASTAPFLGLLGTVWGVMESFGAMSTGGSALLADVAPGISGALLTTAVGLIVALPSAFAYNMLSTRVRHLVVQLDNFSQELVADLEQLRQDA